MIFLIFKEIFKKIVLIVIELFWIVLYDIVKFYNS